MSQRAWKCPDCGNELGREYVSGSIRPAVDGLVILPKPDNQAVVRCPDCGHVFRVANIVIRLMPAKMPATVTVIDS